MRNILNTHLWVIHVVSWFEWRHEWRNNRLDNERQFTYYERFCSEYYINILLLLYEIASFFQEGQKIFLTNYILFVSKSYVQMCITIFISGYLLLFAYTCKWNNTWHWIFGAPFLVLIWGHSNMLLLLLFLCNNFKYLIQYNFRNNKQYNLSY